MLNQIGLITYSLVYNRNQTDDSQTNVYLTENQLFYLDSVALTVSFAVCLVLVNIERSKGLTSSVLLTLFWTLLASGTLVLIDQEIRKRIRKVYL